MRMNWVVVLAPPLLIFLTLLLGTQVVFLSLSFFRDMGIGQIGDKPTLFNYMRAFTEPFFLNALTSDLFLALTVVAMTLVVGYPIAYIISRMRSAWGIIFLAAIVVSSFVSIAIKVLGLIIIFGANGPLNRLLLWSGVISEHVAVIGTMPGVAVGLVYLGLVFMIMMLFSVMQSIPRSFEEAAQICGAHWWRTIWRVVIPLSLPGVVSASLILFNLAMSALVPAVLLGGGRVMTLPVVIQRTVLLNTEYGMAAALSTVLMLVVIVINVVSTVIATRIRATRLAVT